MLLESVLLYKGIYNLALYLGEPYRKQVIKEENEEWGVYRCKDMVDTAKAVGVGGSHAECIAISDNKIDEDPISVILGVSTVYLNVPEINYLSKVEESKNWDSAAVESLLRHIKDSQLVRTLVAQSCT